MKFDNMKYNDYGKIWGHGSDIVGEFNIEGNVYPDRRISFMKQYKGKHQVSYDGKMDKDNNVIGNWELNTTGGEKYSGKFELKKHVKYGLFSYALPKTILKMGT